MTSLPTTPASNVDDDNRPEPVVNAARLGGGVAAVVVAALGLIALVLAGHAGDLDALSKTLGALFTALGALTAYLAPLWQAYKARRQVTPLVDPRTADGEPLTTVAEHDDRHAAALEVLEPPAPLEHTPEHAAPE